MVVLKKTLPMHGHMNVKLTPYHQTSGFRHFEGLQWLHLQGWAVHKGHFGLLTLQDGRTAILWNTVNHPPNHEVLQCHAE